ncbi:hypothetical protein RB195_015570 [Necator americanus]|uniref:RNA-directed DNA polymerase n=1 Tax=Necator americanus TaxID=51031 RepID=A0ABR1E7U6_NECAM
MTTVEGCLLTASRRVVPKSLRYLVLSTLHKAHPGKTRVKMLARSFVYWPTMDSDIEKLVKTYPRCDPWQRIRPKLNYMHGQNRTRVDSSSC